MEKKIIQFESNRESELFDFLISENTYPKIIDLLKNMEFNYSKFIEKGYIKNEINVNVYFRYRNYGNIQTSNGEAYIQFDVYAIFDVGHLTVTVNRNNSGYDDTYKFNFSHHEFLKDRNEKGEYFKKMFS